MCVCVGVWMRGVTGAVALSMLPLPPERLESITEENEICIKINMRKRRSEDIMFLATISSFRFAEIISSIRESGISKYIHLLTSHC